MENVSIVTVSMFPPPEYIDFLQSTLLKKSIEIQVTWIPNLKHYEDLRLWAKSHQEVLKFLEYIPADSRTPEFFMSSNGPALILYSKMLDKIAAFDRGWDILQLEVEVRKFLLPGVTSEVTECDNCHRVDFTTNMRSIAEAASIYNLNVSQEPFLLCPFDFLYLCWEYEYFYPEKACEVLGIPRLPNGKPLIWVGDPRWMDLSHEERLLHARHQRC